MGKRKRTRFWIDAPIQGALAKRVVIHWLILISLTLSITVLLQFFSDPTKSFQHHVRQVLWEQRIFLVVVAALIPAFVQDSIKLSNRFVGPVFRLREAISGVAEGKPPTKLDFRDTDFWSDLATSFNKLIDLGCLHSPREQGKAEQISQRTEQPTDSSPNSVASGRAEVHA